MSDTADTEDRVNVVGPDGWSGTIPRAKLEDAQRMGYRLEDPEASHERFLESEYGDHPILAGLEGAARGVTLGASDEVLQAFGASKEGIREREQRNKAASLVGNVGGAILPALLSGGDTIPESTGEVASGLLEGGAAATGASAVSRVAAATPAGLTARAGQAAEDWAKASNLVQGLADGGVVARAAARAIPTVVRGGAEGALYGAGQGVSNISLSDNPMSAEAIVAELGSEALYGTGLGLAGGTLGATLHESARAARRFGTAVMGRIEESAAAEEAARLAGAKTVITDSGSADVAGMDLATARRARAEEMKAVREAQGTNLAKARDDLASAREAEVEALEAARAPDQQKVAEDIGAYREMARDVGKDYIYQLPKGKGYGRELVASEKKLASAVGNMKALARDPEIALDAIERHQQRLAELVKVVPSADVDALIKESEQLQQRISQVSAPVQSSRLSAIDSQIETLKTPAAEATSDRLQALEDQIRTLQAPKPAAPAAGLGDKLAEKATGAAVGGALGMLLGHGPVGAVIGAGLESVIKNAFKGKLAGTVLDITKRLEGAGDLVASGVRAVKPAESAMRIFTNTELAPGTTPTPLPTVPRPRDDEATTAFRQHMALIQAAVANLAAIQTQIHANLAAVRASDPKLADQIEQVALARLQFLAAAMPKQPDMGTPTDGFTRSAPSPSDIAKAAQAFAAVEDPLRLLQDAAAGQISPSAVAAVRTVYPQMFGKMQEHVIGKMTSLRKEMPYSKRFQLTHLFGVPADSTLRPAFIRSTQAAWAAARAKPASKSPRSNVGNLKTTPTQMQRLSSPQ